MPLDQSALANALEDIMLAHRPKSPAAAGKAWAKAYADFCKTATSLAGGAPSSVAASQAALESVLVSAFSNPRSPAPATAAAFGAGVVAFWLPVLFSGPVPGTVVTSALAGPILQSGLLTLWPSLMLSRAQAKAAAAQHAALFLAATITVVVIHVFPPPAPPVTGPIL